MKGLDNNLSGRSYCKHQEISQEGQQEETTQTRIQGQQMKKIKRNEFSQKTHQ
jgi:hypothetical protein